MSGWVLSSSDELLGQGDSTLQLRCHTASSRTKVQKFFDWTMTKHIVEEMKFFTILTFWQFFMLTRFTDTRHHSLDGFAIHRRNTHSSEKYKIVDVKVSQYRMKMILTINNLDQHDAGNYVCVSGECTTKKHSKAFYSISCFLSEFSALTKNNRDKLKICYFFSSPNRQHAGKFEPYN